MEALQFTLAGRMAHFRRPWTNSSASTYWMPPPSTVRGIVGAVMGWAPKDLFSNTKDLLFGVELLVAVRTLTQTVNYLKDLAKLKDRSARGGWTRTQTTLELLVPMPSERSILFRFTVAGKNGSVGEIHAKLRDPAFPLSLGPVYCLASMREVTYPMPVKVIQIDDGEFHGMAEVNGKNVAVVVDGGMSRVERMTQHVSERRSALKTGTFLVHDRPATCKGTLEKTVTIDGRTIALF